MMVATVFCNKLSTPIAVYHLSHDGSLKYPAIPGTAKVMIGDEAHHDSPLHGLKVFTTLEQIHLENAKFVWNNQQVIFP